MPQIVADIPLDQLERLSRKAEAQQLSVSKYLERPVQGVNVALTPQETP